MKTLTSRLLNIPATAFAAFASLLFSCSKEVVIDDVPQPSGDEAAFVVSAAALSQSVTRVIAGGGADDNDVRDITVLLFDAASPHYYKRSIHVTNLSKADPVRNDLFKFTAKIPHGNYKAFVLANVADEIDRIDLTSLTMNDFELSFYRAFNGKYNAAPGSTGYRPFVMSSGRMDITVPGTGCGDLNNPVRLFRDVAKINVKFVSKEVGDRFEINQIRLCNYNTVSYPIPGAALWDFWVNNKTKDVTPPLFTADAARTANIIVSGYQEDLSIAYKRVNGEISDKNECIDEIFTAERPADANADNNLCLLINGNVSIDGNTYNDRWYKLVFVRKDVSGTPRHVNILRNYVYTMMINAVSDPGYPTAEEAYNAAPGNLTFDLGVIEDDGLDSAVYNGQYYLAVTKNVYEFSCISELAQELKICTDYPGGWKISPAPAVWPEWLNKDWPWTAGADGPQDVTAADKLCASVNVVDRPREYAFTVAAGSLSQRITVRQKPNFYIFATPGVVGIKLSDYRRLMNARARSGDMALLDPTVELSVKGSSTYAGTIVDKPKVTDEFGGLEQEPVYSIYTMFGSTIAVLLGADESWVEDGSRVVWTSLEYEGSTVGPWQNSTAFMPAEVKNPSGTDYDIVDNPAKGHGDICREVTHGEYRIPVGNPWQLADGTQPFGNGTSSSVTGGANWWELANSPAKFWLQGLTDTLYTGVKKYSIMADRNETIFLPAAGFVNDYGYNTTMGHDVKYRTTTAVEVSGKKNGYLLFANRSEFSSFDRAELKMGLPVRCVKASPTPVVVPPKPPLYLTHERNTLPAVIKMEGGKWSITAKTNLPTWGIRVYEVKADNSLALLNDVKNLTGSPSDQKNTEFTEQFTVPRNDGVEPRKLAFYIYSQWYDKGEVFAAERAQEAALTLPLTGFPAPPGVLGVTPSGELTLRGSKLYKGTDVEKNSQFSPVHEEAVFVAYFRWGSMVAINSTSNAANPDALKSNGDAFGFSDFDWIHPDYSYGGQKGGKALKALLGSGKTPAQMWSTLPMNGTLENWSPTNTAAATGDPCPYATINAAKKKATGWHVPSGSNGWNGIPSTSLESRLVTASVKLTNGLIVEGRRDTGTGANGWGMFLPFAGNRQSTGLVSGRGFDGTYWSATRFGASGGNYLATGSGSANVSSNINTMGMPIRCVK